MSATATKSKAKKSEPNAVVVRNAGPVEGEFRFPLDSYGVYELQGSNGVGKSTVLKLMRLLTGHRVDVTVHAGQLDGSIEALGVVAPLGRKRPSGELEVASIDSEKWDIADVTDPAGERPEVRDANRIKALAALCKAKADPAPYRELLADGELDRLIDRRKLETDDPLILQSRVKDAIEAAARQAEAERDNAKLKATQCQAAIEGIDLSLPCDGRELATAAEQAAARLQALESQVEAAQKAHKESVEANRKLTEAKSGYKGPTLDAANEALSKATLSREEADNEVDRLEKLLASATTARDKAVAQEEHQEKALEAAEQHARLIQQLETLIAAQARVPKPEPSEIDTARQSLEAAREAANQGVRVRDAKAKAVEREGHLEAAKDAESRAISLRGAAAMTFDILTRSVQLTGIRIENVSGDVRLVVDHPKTGKPCYFDGDNGGLSDGQRAIFAMRTLRHLIPSPGMFAVPQRVWESLDPQARAELHREAVEQKVFLFAALPTDGALRVERPYR